MTIAQRTTHRLAGLRTEPLSSYLSALGVVRLVSEQKDPTATCWWEEQSFVLETELSREELQKFFLEEYAPTPLTSPWNGGSGYYSNDNKDAVTAIEESDHERFASYRETLSCVKNVLSSMGLEEKPEGPMKPQLLKALRGALSDESLVWLDATSALGEVDSKGETSVRYAPLLGTGGNDGRLEFSNNFMQRLVEFFLSSKSKPKQTNELLQSALFGEVGRFLSASPVGQFDPGSAGGVNLGVGFEAKAALNPWYYILMIEGTVVLATAAVGRFRSGNRLYQGSAFPFTVRHMGAGHGKLAAAEGNRDEVWLPTWNKPTHFREVSKLFAEGRAQNGSKQARNPIEFSIALATYGTSRGLDGFHRFAFLQRNGKSYFATPLGYYPVGAKEGAGLIRRLEQYFSACRGIYNEHSNRSQTVMRGYDTAVLDFMKTGKKEHLTRVLEQLGSLHRYLAGNEKLCDKVRTLPTLGKEWAELACDDTPEFHLAYSLASLGAGRKEPEYNLRAQLSPYNPKTRSWDFNGYIPRWKGRDLAERLVNLLEHRLREAKRVGFVEDKGSTKKYNSPVRGGIHALPAHLELLASGHLNEDRLEKLIFALVLLEPHSADQKLRPDEKPWFLGLPFLVCKLALHQGIPMREEELDSEDEAAKAEHRDTRVPPVSIVRHLATGQSHAALQTARRFLLSRPCRIPQAALQTVGLSAERQRRLAAALCFPISDRTYRQFYDRIILPKLEKEEREENQND